MKCPVCSKQSTGLPKDGRNEVIETREHTKTGSVRRRRICPFCNHRYTTYEVHQREFNRLKNLDRDLDRLNLLEEFLSETLEKGSDLGLIDYD